MWFAFLVGLFVTLAIAFIVWFVTWDFHPRYVYCEKCGDRSVDSGLEGYTCEKCGFYGRGKTFWI